MIFEELRVVAVLVLAGTTLYLLLNQSWRWSILILAVQYLAVFALAGLVWPLGLAAVKLVSGWMAGAVFGAAQPAAELVEDAALSRSTFLFRLLLGILVIVLVVSSAPALADVLPEPAALVYGAMLLIGMGLLQLGVTTRPLRVLLGLLTTLSGFELLYAGLESSVLVAGLLAVVTLGLALIGSYLLDTLAEPEEDA